MNTRPLFWFCCFTLAAMVAMTAFPGCSGAKPEPPKAPEGAAKPAEAPLAKPVEPGLDIGDVEAGVVVSATVPAEAITDQVSVDNMETARKRLSMATVTVKPPYPQKLIVRVTLAPQVSYEKQPVVVRGKLRRDEQPIEPEFSTIVSKGGPIGDNTIKFDFDVMQGLSAPPDTMLVYARFDAWLMPKGTPPTGLDPNSANSDQHTVLTSNPVRINFVK